ncbi:hypothetical protein WUBG_01489, partial [Wuchereria bancrofti]
SHITGERKLCHHSTDVLHRMTDEHLSPLFIDHSPFCNDANDLIPCRKLIGIYSLFHFILFHLILYALVTITNYWRNFGFGTEGNDSFSADGISDSSLTIQQILMIYGNTATTIKMRTSDATCILLKIEFHAKYRKG